ncbi:MAG: acyl-CoA thioesterase [Chitinivibrionales bacterium]|nr:acyl-CoA thioesterase [Chitinivibrionales bacterium]
MFRTKRKIRIYDVDAANRIFFARQFYFIHDCWEEYLDSIGHGIGEGLKRGDYVLPIVHAEADYKHQLFVGDEIDIALSCIRIGDSSFSMAYDIQKGMDLAGTARTVHVSLDASSGKKISLPGELKEKLAALSVHRGS